MAADPIVEECEVDKLWDVISMNCEMVKLGQNGKKLVLARVSIVDYYGYIIFNEYVKPKDNMTEDENLDNIAIAIGRRTLRTPIFVTYIRCN